MERCNKALVSVKKTPERCNGAVCSGQSTFSDSLWHTYSKSCSRVSTLEFVSKIRMHPVTTCNVAISLQSFLFFVYYVQVHSIASVHPRRFDCFLTSSTTVERTPTISPSPPPDYFFSSSMRETILSVSSFIFKGPALDITEPRVRPRDSARPTRGSSVRASAIKDSVAIVLGLRTVGTGITSPGSVRREKLLLSVSESFVCVEGEGPTRLKNGSISLN